MPDSTARCNRLLLLGPDVLAIISDNISSKSINHNTRYIKLSVFFLPDAGLFVISMSRIVSDPILAARPIGVVPSLSLLSGLAPCRI